MPGARNNRGERTLSWPVTLLRVMPPILALTAALLLLGDLLIATPPRGVADNGDFQRVMGMSGLWYGPWPQEQRFFDYFHTRYDVGWGNFGTGYYPSTQVIPVLAAVGLESLLTWDGLFDIRWLGALYSLLLLAALVLLLRWARGEHAIVRWLLALLAVFVCCDSGYVLYFNSLYGEPVAYIATLFLGICTLGLIRAAERGRLKWWAGFLVSAVFLIGSKVQNAPVGLLLAVLAYAYGAVACRGNRIWQRRSRYGALLLLACSIVIYAAAPSGFKDINKYQSVFYGILLHSPDPAADLRELGLDPALAVNAGTNYFEPAPIPQNSAEIEQRFQQRIGHGDILAFYLKHPARLLSQLARAVDSACTIKPAYLGNYEPSAGKLPRAVSLDWAWWSRWKVQLLPHHWGVLAALYAVFLAMCFRIWAAARRSGERSREWGAWAGAALAAVGAVSYAVPVVADGFADLEKHLFQFNVVFDWMAAALVVQAMRMAVRKFAAGR